MARRKVDPLSIRIIIEIVVLSAVLIGLLIGIGAVWAGVETDGGDPTGSTGSGGGSGGADALFRGKADASQSGGRTDRGGHNDRNHYADRNHPGDNGGKGFVGSDLRGRTGC